MLRNSKVLFESSQNPWEFSPNPWEKLPDEVWRACWWRGLTRLCSWGDADIVKDRINNFLVDFPPLWTTKAFYSHQFFCLWDLLALRAVREYLSSSCHMSHESTPKGARKTNRENVASEHETWKIRIYWWHVSHPSGSRWNPGPWQTRRQFLGVCFCLTPEQLVAQPACRSSRQFRALINFMSCYSATPNNYKPICCR